MERLKELMKIKKLKEKDIYKELKEAGPTEEDDPIPFQTRDRKSSDFDSSRTDTERTASEASEREREEIEEDREQINTSEDLIKFKEKLFSELGLNKADADELNRLFEKDDIDTKDLNSKTEDGTEIRDPMSNPIIDEIGNKEVKDLFRSDAFENVLKHSKDLYDFKKPKVHFQCDLYNDSLTRFFEISRIEDENNKKDQISLVMKFFTKELAEIKDDYLSPEYQHKKKVLLKLCNLASHYKLKDAANLKKVFDLYRHEKIQFKL